MRATVISIVLYCALVGGGALSLASEASDAQVSQLAAIPSERLEHAADVVIPAWQGEEVTLGPERGRVLVLSFWGLWCEPCRQEMPLLQELHEAYGTEGLVVGAVHTDGVEFAGRVAERFAEEGFEFRSLFDADGSVMRIFADRPSTPLTVVIGPDGRMLYRHAGFDDAAGNALRDVVSAAMLELNEELPE